MSDAERQFPTDGVGRFFGFRQTVPGEISIEIRPELVNFGGRLSGVASFALIDYAMGSALWDEVKADRVGIATTNIAINYVAAARDGTLTCRATVDRRTRGAAALRAEVVHEDGRLIATAVGSYAIIPLRQSM